MKTLILLISTLALLSCSNPSNPLDPDGVPDREVLAAQSSHKTAQLLKSKDLQLIGSGGSMMNDVSMMALSFHSLQQLGDISNARKLIVECAELYLKEINSNRELRPFLHQYPFEIKNIKIVIFTSRRIPSSSVFAVAVRRGNIEYMKPVGDSFDTLMIESYADAQKKLVEEKSQTTLSLEGAVKSAS